ncbi:hypothetical protein N7481_007240 [Penicillium waksmanii]|uniref:uncharacterized protein n=1 Tax=Penicillium waksmanii TaxID=69791 RepID=UPI002548FAB3|nr:uncharacterized protein N7481_007240 [Penicillium waksmanii]KAJ5979942.1 hypothetical protein N7481_007240 [Penicillium waksmanii]
MCFRRGSEMESVEGSSSDLMGSRDAALLLVLVKFDFVAAMAMKAQEELKNAPEYNNRKRKIERQPTDSKIVKGDGVKPDGR